MTCRNFRRGSPNSKGSCPSPISGRTRSARSSRSRKSPCLRGKVAPLLALERQVADLEVLIELARRKSDTASAAAEVEKEYAAVSSALDDFELKMLLSGPNDRCNAFLTSNPARAGPSRAIGRTCSCGCISAGSSGTASRLRSWTFSSARSRHQVRDHACVRRICLRLSRHGTRRASARAHLAVRCEQAAAHLIRRRRCRRRTARKRADRDQ